MARLILALMLLSVPLIGAAAEPSHTADQLRAALAGNTVTGIFGPRHYRQYFDASGDTTYVEQGRRPTRGTWRVTEEGHFCSVWGQTESCYDVVLNGADITWGPDWPTASIVPGNQLNP